MSNLTYKKIDSILKRVSAACNSNSAFNLLPFGKDFYQSNEDYIQLFLDIQKEEKISALPRELWEYILELKYNSDNQHDFNIILMFNKMITSEINSMQINRLYTLKLYDFSSELISHNDNKKDYKIDIGIIQMDMGYYLKCCYDKIYKQFFFRLCGGDYHNYVANEDNSLILNTLYKYENYLFSYKQLIDILIKHKESCCVECEMSYNITQHVLQCNM